VAALRAALLAAVTAEDVQDVMAALLVQANKGNVSAARLYLAYSAGKPAASRAAEHTDVQEEPIPPQTAPPAADAENGTPVLGLSTGGLTSPARPCVPPLPANALNPRARAEHRRAERKRLKAERKKIRRLLIENATRQAHAAPSRNGPNGQAAPLPNGLLTAQTARDAPSTTAC
jgi:hypothetical protein